MNLRCIILSLICAAIAIVAADNRAHAQEFRLPSVVDSGPEDIGPIGEPIVGAQDFGVIDADAYVDPSNPFGHDEYWSWHVLPQGLVYRSYLASTKDSRMYGGVNEARDESTFWDATVGARLGILRYGTTDYILPDGFQVDAEGSAQVRLDVPDDVDVRAVDFRGGVPITYGIGKHRFKTGYYHLSSHLGDEFLLKNVGYPRLNFARDVLLFGYSYYATPNLRFYGEAGWAFYTIVSEPWEFQFGIDYAPQYRTGIHGAPFFAINTHIRQELDYSGNLNVQFGWAWRADNGPQLLRAGFQYFNGMNSQYSFYNQHEDFFGFGVWYDF